MAMHYKIGFLGAGNMTQAIVKGLVESNTTPANHIWVSNRTPGKLQKLSEQWVVQVAPNNEALIENCDVIVLATKPQDLGKAIEPLMSIFNPQQIVFSLAAGVTMNELEKKMQGCRLARVMPNTPATIKRGVTGYLLNMDDAGLETVVEDTFSPLGHVMKVEDESQLEALTVACASGTGFVFELMMYFQDWLEEHGFDLIDARKMVVKTFAGASLLAAKSQDKSLEDLQSRVTSKKGVTSAGLESMRELEIERLLRYSFEKAALRNQELAKQSL